MRKETCDRLAKIILYCQNRKSLLSPTRLIYSDKKGRPFTELDENHLLSKGKFYLFFFLQIRTQTQDFDLKGRCNSFGVSHPRSVIDIASVEYLTNNSQLRVNSATPVYILIGSHDLQFYHRYDSAII